MTRTPLFEGFGFCKLSGPPMTRTPLLRGFSVYLSSYDVYPSFQGVFLVTGPPTMRTPLFKVFFLVSAGPLLLLRCVPLFLRGFLQFTGPPTMHTPLFEGFFGLPVLLWHVPLFSRVSFLVSAGPPLLRWHIPLFEGFFLVLASLPVCCSYDDVYPSFWGVFFCLIFFDNNNPLGCLSLHLEVNNFLIITPYGGF